MHAGGKREEALRRFFLRAGMLKKEPRRGWVKKLRLKRVESVADHSYRTALIAMIVSDMRGLDTGKAMRLALLHDLPESLVGDATPEERSGKTKLSIETRAMLALLRDVPADLRRRYELDWSDFIEGRSEEARLVGQVDKLEMGLQAWEYRGAGRGVHEFLVSAREHVHDPDLLEILPSEERRGTRPARNAVRARRSGRRRL